MVNVWLVLDLVDGEIARFRGTSHFGRYYDTTNADIMYGILLLSIGIGVHQSSGPYIIDIAPAMFIILGALASIFKILFRLSESKFYKYLNILDVQSQETDEKEKDVEEGQISLKYFLLIYIFNQIGLLHTFVPFFALVGRLDVYVLFYGISFPAIYVLMLLSQYRNILALQDNLPDIKII